MQTYFFLIPDCIILLFEYLTEIIPRDTLMVLNFQLHKGAHPISGVTTGLCGNSHRVNKRTQTDFWRCWIWPCSKLKVCSVWESRAFRALRTGLLSYKTTILELLFNELKLIHGICILHIPVFNCHWFFSLEYVKFAKAYIFAINTKRKVPACRAWSAYEFWILWKVVVSFGSIKIMSCLAGLVVSNSGRWGSTCAAGSHRHSL